MAGREMREFSKKDGADGQTRTADRRFTNSVRSCRPILARVALSRIGQSQLLQSPSASAKWGWLGYHLGYLAGD